MREKEVRWYDGENNLLLLLQKYHTRLATNEGRGTRR